MEPGPSGNPGCWMTTVRALSKSAVFMGAIGQSCPPVDQEMLRKRNAVVQPPHWVQPRHARDTAGRSLRSLRSGISSDVRSPGFWKAQQSSESNHK